jgi:hypothetical protein
MDDEITRKHLIRKGFTMYTVTFQDENQTEQVSRFFETVRAARKWARWLGQQSFTRTVSLYRGQAGEELIERTPVGTPNWYGVQPDMRSEPPTE